MRVPARTDPTRIRPHVEASERTPFSTSVSAAPWVVDRQVRDPRSAAPLRMPPNLCGRVLDIDPNTRTHWRMVAVQGDFGPRVLYSVSHLARIFSPVVYPNCCTLVTNLLVSFRHIWLTVVHGIKFVARIIWLWFSRVKLAYWAPRAIL